MMLMVEILLIIIGIKWKTCKQTENCRKNEKSPQPTGNWLRGNWKHSENSRKKLKFSLKNCKIGRQGREDSPQSARQKSPTALKRLDISIKCASKMARRFCCFCTIQQRKKPMASFLSWAYGGKKGIRTLEGFMGPTRFPVVRLRPAQPSFHLFCCIASPDDVLYYSKHIWDCQAIFWKKSIFFK